MVSLSASSVVLPLAAPAESSSVIGAVSPPVGASFCGLRLSETLGTIWLLTRNFSMSPTASALYSCESFSWVMNLTLLLVAWCMFCVFSHWSAGACSGYIFLAAEDGSIKKLSNTMKSFGSPLFLKNSFEIFLYASVLISLLTSCLSSAVPQWICHFVAVPFPCWDRFYTITTSDD